MKVRVVCVSRTMAAGGEDVARAVSQRLGFRYVDEEIVAQAAEREKVGVAVIENAERRQSFLDRVLESFAVAPIPEAMVFTATLGYPVGIAGADPGAAAFRGTEHYRQLIRDVVLETAAQGDVVIVAHAAAMALGGREDVLRVFVTASPQTRAARLAETSGLDPKEAAKEIADSDKSRRDYFKSFYQIRDEQPVHYDVVVNTDFLSPQQAVDVVVAAVRA
jgi:Cytidylate kinase-like family